MGDVGDPKGVGGEEPSKVPHFAELEELQKTGGPSEGEKVDDLLHAKVRTLGDLKNTMVKFLGPEEGMKLYNQFMKSIAMQILNQVQSSAAQAKKAAQRMREGNV